MGLSRPFARILCLVLLLSTCARGNSEINLAAVLISSGDESSPSQVGQVKLNESNEQILDDHEYFVRIGGTRRKVSGALLTTIDVGVGIGFSAEAGEVFFVEEPGDGIQWSLSIFSHLPLPEQGWAAEYEALGEDLVVASLFAEEPKLLQRIPVGFILVNSSGEVIEQGDGYHEAVVFHNGRVALGQIDMSRSTETSSFLQDELTIFDAKGTVLARHTLLNVEDADIGFAYHDRLYQFPEALYIARGARVHLVDTESLDLQSVNVRTKSGRLQDSFESVGIQASQEGYVLDFSIYPNGMIPPVRESFLWDDLVSR